MNLIPIVAAVFGATYAVQPAYGVEMSREIYLWIPEAGNMIAVWLIALVGSLSDRIGRRPCMIIESLSAGLLAYPYLLAVGSNNIPAAIGLMAFVVTIVSAASAYSARKTYLIRLQYLGNRDAQAHPISFER